ncbi:hypothetical protein Tco_0805095 [Tanacetum coccineum]
MLWEPLPKDVVGASPQRCGGNLYPKMWWEPLPKDVVDASWQMEMDNYIDENYGLLYQLLKDKDLLKLDWAKNQKTISSLKKTIAFATKGNNNSDTDKIMARMDAMTMKMDAQYKEF